MKEEIRLTPDQLALSASLLYGPEWQRELSTHIQHPNHSYVGVSERHVRHWVAGTRKIPLWVRGALIELMDQRVDDIEEVRRELVSVWNKEGMDQ